MKIGDTKEIHGFIIKAIDGYQGCAGCQLYHDKSDYSIKQRLAMFRICNNMPINCQDSLMWFKIVGVAE